ncbi:MAG: hypothetical protein RR791_05500 [Lachnospiraceae bacterium]
MMNRFLNQRVETHPDENEREEQMTLGIGVIYVKSRKSDDKIWMAIDEMKGLAESTYINIIDVIVDESSGCNIDRKEIDVLCDWIENSPVGIIFLQSIYDISKDLDDLTKFLERAENYQMIIVDMDANRVISPFTNNDKA